MLIDATVAKRSVIIAFRGGETANVRLHDFSRVIHWLALRD